MDDKNAMNKEDDYSYEIKSLEEEFERNKKSVIQTGDRIYCSEIFERLKELMYIEKDKPYEEKSNKSKIYNRFSGGYFSPTFVKSFSQCPANSFISSCIPRTSSEIMNFGSCVHKVFERIVLEHAWEDRSLCEKIASEEISNFEIKSNSNKQMLFDRYLTNFLASPDYLNKSSGFPWDNVQMFPEMFEKSDLSIFDIPLGKCFTLMDRVDIRDEGIFVIDYKTGVSPYNNQKLAEFIDNYLNQMINYSWVIHKKYGIIPRVFAYLPYSNEYIEFPVKSLKGQSMFVEKILQYYNDIRFMRREKFFEERTNEYCKYCKIKSICNKYNKANNNVSISLDLNAI